MEVKYFTKIMYISTRLHGITFLQTLVFTVTAVRTGLIAYLSSGLHRPATAVPHVAAV
jgi:hypothetical protein